MGIFGDILSQYQTVDKETVSWEMKLTDINLKAGKKQKEKKEFGYATAY